MEEDAPAKPSVAELAGKFKGRAPPIPAVNEGSKPVRRRPPRTLQLPGTPQGQGEEEEKPALTSPHPGKTKRNSSMIEKLQANLALSPTALNPSPKSPGLRLFPPSFTPPSPCHSKACGAPVTPTSPGSMAVSPRPRSEDEPPATFEAPAAPSEGALLPSINKSRARVSIRRRPPSRRHRKSSSGEEVGGATGEDTPSSAPAGPEAQAGEEEEKGDDVFGGEEKMDVQGGAGTDAGVSSTAGATEPEPPPTDSQLQAATAETEPEVEHNTESQAEEEQEGGQEGERGTLRGSEGGKGEGREGSGEDGSSKATEDLEEVEGKPLTSSVTNVTREGDEVPCDKKRENDSSPKEETEGKMTEE